MPHWLPAVLFGSTIAVFGFVMVRRNLRAWHDVANDRDLNPFDLVHFRDRYSRRVQLSGMLLTIGVLVAVGDVFVWNFGPAPAAVFWIMVLMLGCWTALLALGDLTSVHAHSQVLKKRVEQQRQALADEVAAIRQRAQSEDKTNRAE